MFPANAVLTMPWGESAKCQGFGGKAPPEPSKHAQTGRVLKGEQGRRRPKGPAQALLRVFEKDPKAVVRALVDRGETNSPRG